MLRRILAHTRHIHPTIARPLTATNLLIRGFRMATTAAAASASSNSASVPSTLDPLPSFSRLSPRVLRLLGGNPGPMTLQGTNTYLLGVGSHRVLVDTGEGVPEWKGLLRRTLAEQGVRRLTVLLTHWHADHTGGVADVLQCLPRGAVTLHKRGGRELLPPSVLHSLPPASELPLADIGDNERFAVEGATLRALHTPGHTPDHVSLWLEEESALLTGDCVLGAGSAVFADLASYMRSLDRLRALQPQRIYPAHGGVLEGEEARERIELYVRHRLQREAQIVECMQQAGGAELTAVDIVQRIYSDLAPTLLYAAANNVLLHLDKLLQEGRVALARADQQQSQHNAPAFDADGAAHDGSSGPSHVAHSAAAGSKDECEEQHARTMAEAIKKAQLKWRLVA